MTKKRLRIAHIVIQPVLVWDDEDELSPGPELSPVSVPLSQAREMLAGLPAEVEKLESQLEKDEKDK
ncbi:hypothetical protein A2707_04895 [Candidatus Saccharibacteria bacterium RIFCSPHIGHO2_01_FULL_45_15]|nr:MAG: hypothetical protein A2707_04895 [Candidatus Saccharibacteria bacterium RIFCSPHIGHO2_01_FULL_45_15]OGL27916.1 MAG: hypothetical protein A3C39_03890 [Candidatus Saccharibacteria bacterium RIFCSPHIGHO2_02_FULL_46_12]OGL32694.1 MAG: hypothetical protein A3E76_05070 [Candidatus Saccharibacteria bacterium RIFCSPHIGHO2_12_FULL_44_22]